MRFSAKQGIGGTRLSLSTATGDIKSVGERIYWRWITLMSVRSMSEARDWLLLYSSDITASLLLCYFCFGYLISTMVFVFSLTILISCPPLFFYSALSWASSSLSNFSVVPLPHLLKQHKQHMHRIVERKSRPAIVAVQYPSCSYHHSLQLKENGTSCGCLDLNETFLSSFWLFYSPFISISSSIIAS